MLSLHYACITIPLLKLQQSAQRHVLAGVVGHDVFIFSAVLQVAIDIAIFFNAVSTIQ